MTLTKQQKLDMIYELELRLAKEELAEQHVKSMAAIESSKKPMQTAKAIIGKEPTSKNIIDAPEKENALAGHALHQHQRDQWHSLSERQFKELKSLPPNTDIETFADKKQRELEGLLKHQAQDMDRVEKSAHPLETEQAILHSYDNALDPEIMAQIKQDIDLENIEDVNMSHADYWDSYRKQAQPKMIVDSECYNQQHKQDLSETYIPNIQEHFANAQEMPDDYEMGMEI